MKVALLKASAIALLRGVSVHAADEAPKVAVASDCADGFSDGQDAMRRAWEDMGEDCADAWQDVLDEADYVKDDFSGSSQYDRCAREGVDDEVSSIERECFDSPDECVALGKAAATEIVFDEVCDSSRSMANPPDYKEECRDLAITTCRGNIANMIDKYCPNDMPNTSTINDLGRDCREQVNDMVGTSKPTRRPTRRPTGRNPDRPTRRPSRRPSSRPTRRPTRRPTGREPDRCGSEGKCGHCKKSYCPDVQERKECKADFCSLEELAEFFPEDLVNEE